MTFYIMANLVSHANIWFHVQHIYNNEGDLSPFAGLAFDPVDGIVQASPYILGMFLMPVHIWTHLVMLFFTAVWTTNIHDTLIGKSNGLRGGAEIH